MENLRHWDWITLILYLLLSITIFVLLRQSIIVKNQNKKIKILKFNINKKYLYYFILLILLVFFMCTRCVENGIGGTDTQRYMYFFNKFNYVKFNIKNILSMKGWEYFFFNFMVLIKFLNGNYIIFSVIIYSLIVSLYIYYFDRNVDEPNQAFLSMLFILPYLKGMNIVRNILAAAIGLISIEMMKNGKKGLALIAIIFSYLNHYISIVLIGFYLFVNFIPQKWYNTRKKSLIISFSTLILTLISIPLIKQLLLMTRYAGYIDDIEFSIFGYLVYAMMYFFIIFVYDDFIKYIKEKNHFIYYQMIIFLSLVVPPFAVVNGTQRLLLYFEIPRFLMYSDLYQVYYNKVCKKNLKWAKIFKILCFLAVIIWIIFRIWRMYYSSGIMPYKNILFKI